MRNSLLWRAVERFDFSQGLLGGLVVLIVTALVLFAGRWAHNCERKEVRK